MAGLCSHSADSYLLLFLFVLHATGPPQGMATPQDDTTALDAALTAQLEQLSVVETESDGSPAAGAPSGHAEADHKTESDAGEHTADSEPAQGLAPNHRLGKVAACRICKGGRGCSNWRGYETCGFTLLIEVGWRTTFPASRSPPASMKNLDSDSFCGTKFIIWGPTQLTWPVLTAVQCAQSQPFPMASPSPVTPSTTAAVFGSGWRQVRTDDRKPPTSRLTPLVHRPRLLLRRRRRRSRRSRPQTAKPAPS
eukprot:m.15565 g.15565  ORF g.15565 m.15565 type:complete len:252 (-) comp8698_c0_seq1:1460-2215(-)